MCAETNIITGLMLSCIGSLPQASKIPPGKRLAQRSPLLIALRTHAIMPSVYGEECRPYEAAEPGGCDDCAGSSCQVRPDTGQLHM
jgi:hypothetical protein